MQDIGMSGFLTKQDFFKSQTQYLREDRTGTRMPVPEHVWLAEKRERNYRQIHAFGVVIVYEMI
jgi:hypothetical protein